VSTWFGRPQTTPQGLKGRFQQSEVREDLERRAWLRNHARFEIGPSGLKTNIFGAPVTQGCALGYGKSALQA